ncbi:MAG TPA: hypothetical protein VIK18_01820, partial [Pirellulales bacterium]
MIRHLQKFLCFSLVILAGVTPARLLADAPAVPKLSAVVPAEDLAGQLQTYVKELDAALADEATYKSSADKINPSYSPAACFQADFAGGGEYRPRRSPARAAPPYPTVAERADVGGEV